MKTTISTPAPAGNSAGVGRVVTALAPHLGLTPASAHQHVQRMRRELPVLVRIGYQLQRVQWVDWFFGPADNERLRGTPISDGLGFVLAKATADRTEDAAREAYLLRQDLAAAREFDLRLEREQLAIVAARRFLAARHPELRR